MSNSITQSELKKIAIEVVNIVQDIISDRVKPYSQDIQDWATDIFARLEADGNKLAEAVETCLVDILTCDNASWDTPKWGFQENLDKLIEVLKTKHLRKKYELYRI